jgi:hypothetical protein
MIRAACLVLLLAACGGADEAARLEVDERPIPTNIPRVSKP